MANEITVTAADVRPLNGAIVRRAKATEALAFGDAVYIDSATGNIPNVSKTVGNALATANCFGVVVATSPDSASAGATTIAAGDPVDVVTFGPVAGYSGMTPGADIWVSDTAGRLSSVVGTKSFVIGFAESAAVAFVRPGFYTKST